MKWIQKKLVVATLASCLVKQVTYANEALKKAQKYLNDNDLSAAVIELKNAVQSEPKNAEARLLLAETYVKLNNWNAAEKELSKAERLKADRLRWIRAMTKTLTAQGKFEEIPDFIQIKESDSRAIQAEVKAVLGMMDGYRKDMAKAEEAFKKALSLDPNNIQAKIGLANLGLRTGNYQQGLQQIEKVLKQEPGHNEALLLKAQLNLFDGKFDELTLAFLDILLKKGREAILPEIAKDFLVQYKAIKHISTVTLTTAAALGKDAVEAIRQKLVASNVTDDNVEIVTKVDENLIGGFVLEFDDKLYDASVKHKLDILSKDFKDNLYISQIMAS